MIRKVNEEDPVEISGWAIGFATDMACFAARDNTIRFVQCRSNGAVKCVLREGCLGGRKHVREPGRSRR